MSLDSLEPRVGGRPARRDQVDEKSEVVHACVPFREELTLEPLEPAEHLPGEPTHLGELPRDRQRLRAHPVADRRADVLGERGLETRRSLGELGQLAGSSLERSVARDAAVPRHPKPLACPLDRPLVHRREASVRVG